jgi:putative NIF3 family GTP cyclohydrolase 1 type 2
MHPPQENAMKASDIRRHFLSVASWVDPDNTVDRIIIGDPEAEVTRLLVTWISSFPAVRSAVEGGYQMLVTHEPTFWVHANEMETVEKWIPQSTKGEAAQRKRRYIEQHGLVILRVHDAWDGMPELGIPWAWARHLGFEGAPAATSQQGFQHRYDIAPLSLDQLARRVAQSTALLGEPAIQVVGAADRTVSRVGIGTGCYCDLSVFQEMGCDVSIVCDDAAWYWQDIQFAADNDHAVIRVNHGTTEEPGMVTLTQYINDSLPGVQAEHLPHGASFRLVGAAG